MQITHDNHFVPQFYLKNWADAAGRIGCYRTLVSHSSVPEWKLRPLKGVAYRRDLYTSVDEKKEIDEFERWIESDFEWPAYKAIEKVIQGGKLTSSDWEKLALFVASQDVRTPQSYIENMLFWNRLAPELIDETLKEIVQDLETASKNGTPLQGTPVNGEGYFKNVIKVRVEANPKPSTNQGRIKAGVLLGRRNWISCQRHLLNNTANVLLNHKWSIAEAIKGTEWFTSDHPVVKLNYYSDGNYDLKGGWGRNRGNIFMPLSPRHLLFTEIGVNLPKQIELSEDQILLIQRIIAERAHRTIFARKPYPEIKKFRLRKIDSDAFQKERNFWKNWHNVQSAAEIEHDKV